MELIRPRLAAKFLIASKVDLLFALHLTASCQCLRFRRLALEPLSTASADSAPGAAETARAALLVLQNMPRLSNNVGITGLPMSAATIR